MISTKNLVAPALVLLAGTLAPAALCATETTVTDASGIHWFGYRSNTAQTVFAYENETTAMTNLDADSYVWGYLPFSISLSVGDALTLSGTSVFKSVAASSSFYFGLYDCGANAEPTAGTTFSSIVAGTYDMTGFFGGTTLKNGSTSTNVFSRFSGKPPTEKEDGTTSGGAGFMTSNQGKDYIASFALENSSLAHPSAGSAYDFSLTLLRTEAGYEVSLGNQPSVSFSAENSPRSGKFNVIGMKSPGSGITLSHLSLTTTGTVIPEPSAFGLLAGAFALTFAGTRRRKRRK